MTWNKQALENLPTLCTGQSEDLKIETKDVRVWLSRLDGTVSIEQNVNGVWKLVSEGDECI